MQTDLSMPITPPQSFGIAVGDLRPELTTGDVSRFNAPGIELQPACQVLPMPARSRSRVLRLSQNHLLVGRSQQWIDDRGSAVAVG